MDETSETKFDSAHPVAIKDHLCYGCGRRINKGEQYTYSTGMWAYSLTVIKTCFDCLPFETTHRLPSAVEKPTPISWPAWATEVNKELSYLHELTTGLLNAVERLAARSPASLNS